MAKKHFGRFLAFAAIAGAAAAGISYFFQYKSFHKELDEEFHDFEDDFDEFEDTDDNSSTVTRNYVSLTPDRKNEEATDGRNDEGSDVTADEEVSALSGETPSGEQAEDRKEAEVSVEEDKNIPADTTVTVEEMTE